MELWLRYVRFTVPNKKCQIKWPSCTCSLAHDFICRNRRS